MNDAFEYRFEILKKELDSIDSSIRKIDDIGHSIKNWAIITWTGSIAFFLGQPELHQYILFTAIPPLAFLFSDAHWRQIQRRFTFRQGRISDYLNSNKFDAAVTDRAFELNLLDPMALKSTEDDGFKKSTSMLRILGIPSVSLIYISLCLMSILFDVLIETVA